MAETKFTVTTTGRYEELDARDRALVRLIATGDRLAFDHLFRAYRPRLQRFLGHLTHRPLLLDELIDDTMLVVWRRADTFNYSSRVSTWIFAIAHRHALKTLEAGGRARNRRDRRDRRRNGQRARAQVNRQAAARPGAQRACRPASGAADGG